MLKHNANPFAAQDAAQINPAARTVRRRRAERGLPLENALRELARTYLQVQRSLWPEHGGDLLPAATEDVLEAMAEQFRRQFLDGEEPRRQPPIAKAFATAMAVCYLRYSCDNSNPRSLDQQLRLILQRARGENHFVPWAYVFADAAVSGTTAERRGYQLSKLALRIDEVKALYIDEIGRASRDAIEALTLGRSIDTLKKRMIGVSDGFDSSQQMSKFMLSIAAHMNEAFIHQLRSKVNRGMDDAFDRGTNIHSPSVGYHLEPAVDQSGRPLFGKDGDRLHMKVIDPDEAEAVLEAYRLFVEQNWSPLRIGRLFNQRKMGGLRSWEPSTIQQLLRRRTYVGVEIYRRTYKERDSETGRSTIRERPRSEWKIRRLRHLQIVPWRLWKAAQKKLGQTSKAWTTRRSAGEPSRTVYYPSRLIRPTCGCCGSDLMLGRSGKYASFCCLSGISGRHGCTFKGYKSANIIESVILEHLRVNVMTPEFLAKVRDSANRFLEEQGCRPVEDTVPLRSQIKSIEAKRKRLLSALDGEDQQDLKPALELLRGHERRLAELRRQLAESEARNAPLPEPIGDADMEALLKDLRGLLTQEISVAAPILRALTGPITVKQVAVEGEAKLRWVAHFRVDMAAVAIELSRSRNCPTTRALEYLHERGWTIDYSVREVELAQVLPRQKVAASVARLASQGHSLDVISRVVGVSWDTVRNALDHVRAGGVVPEGDAQVTTSPSTSNKPEPLYVTLAHEVVRLRDEGGLAFEKIAHQLGHNVSTIGRAYDWARRDLLLAAAESGRRNSRGVALGLGAAVHKEIRERLAAGESPPEIAAAVGCSLGTAYRIQQKWRAVG